MLLLALTLSLTAAPAPRPTPVVAVAPVVTVAAPVAAVAPVVRPPATDAGGQGVLARVTFLGASQTAGMSSWVIVETDQGTKRAQRNLAAIFAATCAEAPGKVADCSSLTLYSNPMEVGRQLIDQALATKPTLVVATDFLFWFAYGKQGVDGTPVQNDEQRVRMFAEGLAMLERFECPVVVGDLPDRTEVGMLHALGQMPTGQILAELNTIVREWSGEHGAVVMLPFADLVERTDADEGFEIRGHTWPPGSKRSLVNVDGLHPTLEGQVAIAQLVAEVLLPADLGLANTAFVGPQQARTRLEAEVLAKLTPAAK